MRRFRSHLIPILILALLPAILLWPVLFTGRTLLPFDNLFEWEPYHQFAEQLSVELPPHNSLLSDLILENYVWKRFIVECLRKGTLPLWNPYLFCGVPFLAAGQHSAMYPFSLLFYIMPIVRAYSYFTWLQLTLAGLFTYLFLRTLRVGTFGALVGAITYMLSAFMVVSVVFTMIIAAACWLPLLLMMLERIVQRWERGEERAPLLEIAGGAVGLGMHLLAGHVEITYYVLLVMAYYALARIGLVWWRQERSRGWVGVWAAARTGLWCLSLVGLGMGLGAAQYIPLYELVTRSFRAGEVTYEQIVGWAYPLRRVIAFLVPDFFGNPSQHRVFDLLRWRWVPVTRNLYGQPVTSTDWGIKNYVEGGAYLGILPLLLAALALLRCITQRAPRSPLHASALWIFAPLALLSLAFIFGTPLYRLIFLLPGISQLHSPFRWVFPYTFSLAVMAGLGADALSKDRKSRSLPWLGWGALLVGVGTLAALLLSWIFINPLKPLLSKVFTALAKAPYAFASWELFYSYEVGNLALFGSLLAASGGVLLLSRSGRAWRTRWGRLPLWQVAALALLAADLLLFSYGFNSAADPKLAEFKPPVVDFLQSDPDLYRFTTLEQDSRTFNANVGMYYGLYDVRGYDSLIPKQYADYMELIEHQGQLLYNRISPLFGLHSLDSQLLDLLNVKYILTTRPFHHPAWKLVYDQDLMVYRNEEFLPRAFVVREARVVPDREERESELQRINPRAYVLLEEEPALDLPMNPHAGDCTAKVLSYGPNEVLVEAHMPDPGFLVLLDSYFPGWKAYTSSKLQVTCPSDPVCAGRRRAGSKLGVEAESEVPIYRADGNFRAVQLKRGDWLVRFKYTPLSLKLGLYVSFIAGVISLLLVAIFLWRRFYREREEKTEVQRLAKNSLTPMFLSLLNKGIDTAFAMLMLRVLGPEGAGKYAFAIVVIGYFEILTNFGLNTLLTREVAKDRSQANRYLSNTAILRMILCGVAAILLAAFIGVWRGAFALPRDTILALLLLGLALIPGNLSTALSSLFNAFEQMEYPALVTTVTTVLKVSLGALVLLVGWGFVGLAGVSVVVNLITLAILLWLARARLLRPEVEFDPSLSREILDESYPLMLTHLLSTLFFRMDVTLLQPMRGDIVVGWYTTAYKFLNGLIIIPSSFTVALFPIISRFADSARDSLIRAYFLSIKYLAALSLPACLLTAFYAREIILLFGGPEYLPHAATALRLLIWFFPLSCVNQVTQYVLIAIEQQRFLTKAFLIGVAFNLTTNLIFIPLYGYRASAVITVLSELALLAPFYWCVRRNLTPVPWAHLFWRPILATAAMALVVRGLRSRLNLLVLIPLASLVYLLLLVGLGTFGREDREIWSQLLPGSERWTRWLTLRPSGEEISKAS
ncbi:MAG: oligosaccharide flippase family protein [Chloroflexota bacterium]|nr:oligosaccharide flippase family protein [Chloroflexota bacterium]